MHATEEDVFAWRTLFEAALRALRVLPRQWSGWRRKEGRRGAERGSLKTSGAQLHWLNHQKPLSSPLHSSSPLSTLLPSLSPSLAGNFIETSQLLITAGDSERGCGF